MRTAVAPTSDQPTPTRWGASTPHVRKALKFIKAKGTVTAEQLVEWDATHGRRLFTWNDPKAALEYRFHEARIFLNRFRGKFEGMRVRAFIHIHEDATREIDQDSYYTVETISKHPGMRAQVIEDISRRMTGLASELRMWKLSEIERSRLFQQLEATMYGLRDTTKESS